MPGHERAAMHGSFRPERVGAVAARLCTHAAATITGAPVVWGLMVVWRVMSVW